MATSGLTGGLIAVGAVVLVALVFRAMSRGQTEAGSVPTLPPPAPEPVPEPSLSDATSDEAEEGGDDGLVVAVSSDGRAFVPDQHVVYVLPPAEEGEEWKVGARLERLKTAMARQDWSWHPGDLRGAQIVRGDFDSGPWLLEALGRDGEYISFTFETREAADAAKELFERLRVVKLGEDEEGRPMPPSAEQFAEARRIMSETAAELGPPDSAPDEDDEGDPGDKLHEGTPGPRRSRRPPARARLRRAMARWWRWR